MKTIITIMVLLLSTSATQELEKSTSWKELVSKDNVTLYYKYADCIFEETQDQEWVLLKIENNNNYNVEINWIVNAYYGSRCEGCNRTDDPEIQRAQKLGALKSVEGKCALPMSDLAVFANSLTYKMPQPLTDIKIENLSITKID